MQFNYVLEVSNSPEVKLWTAVVAKAVADFEVWIVSYAAMKEKTYANGVQSRIARQQLLKMEYDINHVLYCMQTEYFAEMCEYVGFDASKIHNACSKRLQALKHGENKNEDVS